MIIQDKNCRVKLKPFLFLIEPTELMFVYNPECEFFTESFICFFPVDLISVMQTR